MMMAIWGTRHDDISWNIMFHSRDEHIAYHFPFCFERLSFFTFFSFALLLSYFGLFLFLSCDVIVRFTDPTTTTIITSPMIIATMKLRHQQQFKHLGWSMAHPAPHLPCCSMLSFFLSFFWADTTVSETLSTPSWFIDPFLFSWTSLPSKLPLHTFVFLLLSLHIMPTPTSWPTTISKPHSQPLRVDRQRLNVHLDTFSSHMECFDSQLT